MWHIDNILPRHLRAHGMELAEDEDFVILLHEHEWIARYGHSGSFAGMVADARAHLAERHGIRFDYTGRVLEAAEA
jgi:hypothetical protein